MVYCIDIQTDTTMHNLLQSYEFILNHLKQIEINDNAYFKPIKPKMTDLELFTLNITAEYLGIDSEHQLFRSLKGTYLFDKIERSVYNRRKRKLFFWMEEIRKKLALQFNEFEDFFVVDSMPLEVCKLARSTRSRICKETENALPNRGYCASQGTHFFGYKLHAVCSVNGVFQSFDLSPASVHDIHFLKDIKEQMADCTILGDRGYLSSEIQLNLFETVKIKLETPMRINQKNYKKQSYIFMKSRKRIETLFSQLCDQFMIRRNYAKTFQGFKTRILSKLTSLTMIQFLNKFVFDSNINNLKINLI
jgi:hypothetical protein